jgi:Family of unknown function (DUF6220)
MPSTLPAPTGVASSETRANTSRALPSNDSTRRIALAHQLVARVLLGGIALQLFFAGLGVFGITTFLPHVIWGTLVVLASLALPLLAWRGHLKPALVRRSWLLVGLMLLQGLLIDIGHVVPVVSALHPVNAMLLVLVTYGLASQTL